MNVIVKSIVWDSHSFDPTQNPIEDIWWQAKQWIRECYHLCQTFAAVKYIFKGVAELQYESLWDWNILKFEVVEQQFN